MRGVTAPARSLLVLLAFAVTACETPQTKAVERFVEREILSQRPETPIGDNGARRAAEQRCGSTVVLLADRGGQVPEDFICIPPPA